MAVNNSEDTACPLSFSSPLPPEEAIETGTEGSILSWNYIRFGPRKKLSFNWREIRWITNWINAEKAKSNWK